MLKILTNADRDAESATFCEMHRGRALVFHERKKWDVDVENGLEVDRYDRELDPTYLVTYDDNDRVTGSLRLLPTCGDTMLSTAFRSFFDPAVNIASPTAWECTRFCVHPAAGSPSMWQRIASLELLSGLCSLAFESGIEHIIGVYEHRMAGVYRRIGWEPEPIAVSVLASQRLYVGIWTVGLSPYVNLRKKLDKIMERSEHLSLTERSIKHSIIEASHGSNLNQF